MRQCSGVWPRLLGLAVAFGWFMAIVLGVAAPALSREAQPTVSGIEVGSGEEARAPGLAPRMLLSGNAAAERSPEEPAARKVAAGAEAEAEAEGAGLHAAPPASGRQGAPLPRGDGSTRPSISAFARYVALGVAHIVPLGTDHILFVLGLFFFSLRLGPLLSQVTAFTLAHTVTLALATLGVVSIAPAIVEPLIAASIVFVAVENILLPRMSPWRMAIVFGFGLLHGLGFASALGETGLGPARLVAGLVGFNLGVELGQLAVIAAAFLLGGLPFGRRRWYRGIVAVPASAAIALVGAWWVIERTLL